MVRRANEKADPGFCAYLGPTIRGVIQNGTIYEGPADRVRESLADTLAIYPRIAHLIVSGQDLPEARRKIKQKGNWLYEQNRLFLSELRNG